MTEHTHSEGDLDIRQQLRDAIQHFEHILPAQAPIKDFVHHNTLHGFQHLAFPEALKAAREYNGAYGYLPENKYREFYQQGRISLADIQAVLNNDDSLNVNDVIADGLTRGDIITTALLYPLPGITACQLNWQIEERRVLTCFQSDVSPSNREKIISKAGKLEAEAVGDLWNACLQQLNLQHFLLHPEEMIDLDPERAEEYLGDTDNADESSEPEVSSIHRQVRKEARNITGRLMRDVGHHITLRGLLLKITGIDILHDIAADLQRHIASFLDLGLSAWHSTERNQGFYSAWKNSARNDLAWVFDQLPEWTDTIKSLPDNAMDSIIQSLTRLAIPQTHWTHYLERMALELPGWSGIFLWRQMHPGYADSDYPVDIMDYLAVRLILEQLYAQRLCREQWQIEANLEVLRWYFRRRRSEFYVRYQMFNQRLPEYLVSQAQRQIQNALNNRSDYTPWKGIADMILIWFGSPMGSQRSGYKVYQEGWQLFRIAQHNGLSAEDISALSKQQVAAIFQCIEQLDDEQHGFLWLQAYERNYRDKLFNALVNNHHRGRWSDRSRRPQAQVIFCMDDREEGIRRHLEELNPMIETLGAAG
ncbi:MAG: putative inorganic carbon transporter subunit DabA, partial [Gammaproteobacteria bacterium]